MNSFIDLEGQIFNRSSSVTHRSSVRAGCWITRSHAMFSVSATALRSPPWLPKQCPRFLSAPEHHGILIFLPAELPVLPPDPPLLRLPVSPEPAEGSARPPPPIRLHRTTSLPRPSPTSLSVIIPTNPPPAHTHTHTPFSVLTASSTASQQT